MIKNGKYFVFPEGNDDFKTLFRRTAAAGVGRPVDQDGFPEGSWTPDLLAEAISQIEANSSGMELRTVQLWFADNDKGISAENIRWLARVFGCDDPEATSAWQAGLTASQVRLASLRREKRQLDREQPQPPRPDDEILPVPESRPASQPQVEPQYIRHEPPARFNLAWFSEEIFSRGSHTNLPIMVFAGAVALHLVSYFLGIHSITYAQADGLDKQVGFLWAPNWTILFIVFMPLFLSFVIDLLLFWKTEGRSQLLSVGTPVKPPQTWRQKVSASSFTYWCAFLICICFAGIFQWISVRLLPVLRSESDYAIDWGNLVIVRPEEIGIFQQVAFTGVAYAYMAVCFYIFYAGLILISSLSEDFRDVERATRHHRSTRADIEAQTIGLRVISGIFRCTISGLFIAICMKLEALYVVTSAPDIWSWLFMDMTSIFSNFGSRVDWGNYSMPTHYTSILVTLLVAFTFFYATIRIRLGQPSYVPMAAMTTTVIFLITGYFLIGAFTGFSIILALAILLSTFCLFRPVIATKQAAWEDTGNVS